MTVEGDIRTALAAYAIERVALVDGHKPTANSITTYKIEVHVLASGIEASITILGLLQAMTAYKSLRAQVVDSWPHGQSLICYRIEVDIRI